MNELITCPSRLSSLFAVSFKAITHFHTSTMVSEAKVSSGDGVKHPPTHFDLLSISKSLLAGGVASGVSRTAIAPLERMKILLQVQNRNTIDLKYIWKTEGFRGLFKGNGTNCARIIPYSAVKFFSYESISRLYQRQPGNEEAQLTPILHLGAGACAGIIAVCATYPMDMVRGRLTAQTAASSHQYRGIFHALSTVFREEGARALYKGWLPSVIGVIPNEGLSSFVYECLKNRLIQSKPFGIAQDSELSMTTRFACVAAAGTVGQTVAYPFDVIRRRMQMVGWKDGKNKIEYRGMVNAFSKTVQHEGFGALYKGLVPNLAKVVPSAAITSVTYEWLKTILE